MASHWLESFFCVFAFLSTVGSECALDTAKYMPFIARVADVTAGKGHGETITTGSIITPDVVLTTCLELVGKGKNDLECQAVQALYRVGKMDSNHFKQAGSDVDTYGCMEKRRVKYKREHPRCPTSTGNYNEWGEEYTRFNIAALFVESPFRNRTEVVPTMPFVSDIATQLAMIDSFNNLRSRRCEIPLFNGKEPKIWFQKHMTFRSVPLLKECRPSMCLNQMRECNATVANHTGFVLCAKRVKQREAGIMWTDYFKHDTDLWDDKSCESMKWVVGAPLVCRGTTIGIVTQCQKYGLIISTIFALRTFLHRIIEQGYTEKIIFMDASHTPPAKGRTLDEVTPPPQLKTFASLHETSRASPSSS